MSLRTAAISNFEPDKIFDLVLAQADNFVNALEEYSQIFGYNGSVARVPTECDIDPTDPDNITLRKKVDILTTWQTITDENVQKCATMLWGENSGQSLPTQTRNSDNHPSAEEKSLWGGIASQLWAKL